MKKVKIKFVDYWPGFIPENDLITLLLKERYEIEFSQDPDYLFYAPFGETHLKYENAIKIYWASENITPDFNLCDYALGYDYINFGDRYIRFPGYYRGEIDKIHDENNLFFLAMNKHLHIDESLLDRAFCSFVYSNGDADIFRALLLSKLNNYKKVDSGGKYKNNNLEFPNGVPNKLLFESEHKFSIACENSSHSGYSTEKIIDSFAARTVPIYWGDPDIEKIFNEKSFVNCNNFSSIDEIVEEVKRIDNNKELYLEMISEPAFVSTEYLQEVQIECLRRFLFHIFDQDKKEAFRRNRVFWGKTYYDKMCKKQVLYEKNTKHINLLKKCFNWFPINQIVRFFRKPRNK